MSATVAAAKAFTLRVSTLREARLPNGQAVLLSGPTVVAAHRLDHPYRPQPHVQDIAVDHFACRNAETHWEIRLEANDGALPRRVFVVQPAEPGPPRVALEFDDWNRSPQLADSAFVCQPGRAGGCGKGSSGVHRHDVPGPRAPRA